MLKNNKKALIITSILILLPIVFGLLLWNRLPEQMATHWGIDGQANGWNTKGFAVFGLPLFILAVHWICVLATSTDKRNQNQSKKAIHMVLWICPVLSILGAITIYGTALGAEFDMESLPYALMGIMLIIIGNYLPKCKHNYTIGIKLPWTLASEENWNATHRFGGRVWVIGGILFLLMMFIPGKWNFPALLVVMFTLVLIPTVYSYLYAKKHA